MGGRRFGLRGQFLLLIVLGLSLLFVLVTVFVTRAMTNNLRQSLLNQSEAFSALATKPIGDTFNTYKDSGTLRIVQQVDKFIDLDENIDNVLIVDANAEVVYQHRQGEVVKIDKQEAATFEPVYTYDDGIISRITEPYFDDSGVHQYSVVYLISRGGIESSISSLERGLIIIALVILVTSVALTFVIINRQFVSPVRELSVSALEISGGNFDKKITPKRRDEIGDLANSVNTMADTLKADIKKLQEVDAMKSEFMMIASHNLRTPLTSIQGYLDNLLTTEQLSPQIRETLEVVAASGNRLSTFAEDMLTVSKLESGEKVIGEKEPADIKKLLQTVTSDFSALAKEKKLSFSADLGINVCMVAMSTPHLRAALWNLLDNALKFTEKGSINLRLQADAQYTRITISDTGIGIAKEEIPKLFTKFHRGTSTMQYNFEGTGIGLYIAKLIVEQHGGSIGIVSQQGSGTTVTLKLPLAH
jgi:signal transduction histidine kinase